MAVQAQYPSNALFLNRSVQEGRNQLGNDYSLQPQPGGFVDQSSNMLFNNIGVGTNSRKRGREITATTTTAPMNSLISMQTQAAQFIDLTQLHTAPPNVVSTGLRLASGDLLQHRQTQQHSPSPQSPPVFSLLSQDFTSQIKQQKDEIEHFLQAQGEQLRRTLAEKRQRHCRALLVAAEESAARRLREKEAEAEKAARRNAELEARAAQLCAESQAWQARARAQEAAAVTLQARLQQAIMSGGCAQQQERDEGGGELGCAAAEDAESAYVDPERVVSSGGPSCRACGKRVASVVLLPCRHLCVCTDCDCVVQACPLCLSFRTSSVEVFLS